MKYQLTVARVQVVCWVADNTVWSNINSRSYGEARCYTLCLHACHGGRHCTASTTVNVTIPSHPIPSHPISSCFSGSSTLLLSRHTGRSVFISRTPVSIGIQWLSWHVRPMQSINQFILSHTNSVCSSNKIANTFRLCVTGSKYPRSLCSA